MGEKKVLNIWRPPSPSTWRPVNQPKIRMLLPLGIKCDNCPDNYMGKGTKINLLRKEDAVGESYRGIQVVRFYFKCTQCAAEISFKTDPQNSDYVVESGATRTSKPWCRPYYEVGTNPPPLEDEEEYQALARPIFVFKPKQRFICELPNNYDDQSSSEDAKISTSNLKKLKLTNEVSANPTESLTDTSYPETSRCRESTGMILGTWNYSDNDSGQESPGTQNN